ncbi:MAG: agmatine deiminase family protein, partial [Bdellovibrionia bacterium]
MTRGLLPLLVFFSSLITHAIPPDQKKLPIGLAPHERSWQGPSFRALGKGTAPVGPVHSLGEWEDSDAVMTLWTNPSYVKALGQNGLVRLIADTNGDVGWWKNWLTSNSIPQANFDYIVTPTDTIWVRDYGPWWIVDGAGKFGIVDTIYNRPRPQDDKFPAYIAQALNVPRYEPGLVHTGGNYYSDGLGSAFSSTLVFKENSSLQPAEILKRMFAFLGIERYVTTPLGENATIEHMDTFGKLVAP